MSANSTGHRIRGVATTLLWMAMLATVSLVASYVAWRWHPWLNGTYPGSHFGDYGYDADNSLMLAMRGDPFAMYGPPTPPLMLPLALLVRLPLLVLGDLLGLVHGNGAFTKPGKAGMGAAVEARYMVGAVACLAAGTAAVIAAGWERSGRARVSVLVLAAALLFGPLTDDALKWGHPEEFLGAGLVAAAFVALARERHTTFALLIGAAFAVKQPFWLLAPVAFLALPPGTRMLGTLRCAAVAAALSLPFIAPHLGEFLGAQTRQVGAAGTDHDFPIGLWGAFGLRDLAFVARPSILALAVLMPVLFAARRGWRLTAQHATALAAMVLIVRSVLDPYNIDYYMLPGAALLLTMEWSVHRSGTHPWGRLPVIGRLPVPVGALMFALLLSGLSFGWATDLLDWAQLYGANGKLYVLVALAGLCWCVVALSNGTIQLTRSRQIVYGGATLVALMLLVGAGAVDRASLRRTAVPPPPGFVAAPLAGVLDGARPLPVYWLGAQDVGDSYLRTAAYGSEASARSMVAIMDYGRVDSIDGITVMTSGSDSKQSRTYDRVLRTCRATGTAGVRRCMRSYYFLRVGSNGALIRQYMGNSRLEVAAGWEALVRTVDTTLFVYTTTKDSPRRVLSRLRKLTPASATAGDAVTPLLRQQESKSRVSVRQPGTGR